MLIKKLNKIAQTLKIRPNLLFFQAFETTLTSVTGLVSCIPMIVVPLAVSIVKTIYEDQFLVERRVN